MIIFLYGLDTFRSRQKLKELKEKFIKEVDKAGLNLTTLNGATLETPEFEKAVSTSPFLAKKRLVVIEDLISKNLGQKIQKEILNILDKNKLSDTIIIFWESGIQDAGSKKKKSKTSIRRSNLLFERLKKEKYVQEFKLLEPAAVKKWALTEIKKRGGKIDPAALSMLVDFIGNDLWQFSSEIEKLLAYSSSGGEISPNDVKNLVKTKLDDDIFRLTDAIGQKNKKLALKLIADQFKNGILPTQLLTKIIWQFKNLLLIKSFMQNYGAGYPAERQSFQLGLHPFVIKKTLNQVKNYNLADLKNIYSQLIDVEYKIKTSPVDPEVLLDLLIVKN